MKFLNFNKVLCLSPHPDDTELGMLGTIVKYQDTDFNILVMTKGGAKGFDKTNEVDRLKEVNDCWTYANVSNVQLQFHDGYFEDKKGTPGWINYLDGLVTSDYDCIFIPTYNDSMYEHQFVNNLCPALTRAKPISLIEYNTVSTLNNWTPNIFIDIKECYDIKLKCLKKFTTQQDKTYFQEQALKAFHSNFQCAKKGVHIVEKYKLIEVIQ